MEYVILICWYVFIQVIFVCGGSYMSSISEILFASSSIIVPVATIIVAVCKTNAKISDMKKETIQMCEKTIDDIGRGNNHSSLSSQHDELYSKISKEQNNMTTSISAQFNAIKERYRNEDARLNKMTDKQADLTDTMKSFIQEFISIQNKEYDASARNGQLCDELDLANAKIASLQKENNELMTRFNESVSTNNKLTTQIVNLQKQIDVLKSKPPTEDLDYTPTNFLGL